MKRNIKLNFNLNLNNIPFKIGNMVAYSEHNDNGDAIYKESKHTCEYITYQYHNDKTISIGCTYGFNKKPIAIKYKETCGNITHHSTFRYRENIQLKALNEKTLTYDDKGNLLNRYYWLDDTEYKNNYKNLVCEIHEEAKYDINNNVIFYKDNNITINQTFNTNNQLITYMDSNGNIWNEHISIKNPYPYKINIGEDFVNVTP